VHHNVVQIYDFGEDKGANYFSMEFVPGQTLGALIRGRGKLDPEVAVGYLLQAARGLKFAHDRGMIHRDIKPENLMLNDQGIVKVADLGLVKTPGGDGEAEAGGLLKGRQPVQGSLAAREAARARDGGGITRTDVAMGTPAYMPPEQAVDAAHVDQRADIYALGCTLYALVTGRPPFQGTTLHEIITKHATEPVVPPEVLDKRVPKALSAIILKMVAKRPEDRYADLGRSSRPSRTSSASPAPARSPRARSTPSCWRPASGSSTPHPWRGCGRRSCWGSSAPARCWCSWPPWPASPCWPGPSSAWPC
jgi:serine/threonine protein kinase